MKEYIATGWHTNNNKETIVTVDIDKVEDLPKKGEKILVDNKQYTTVRAHYQKLNDELFGTAALIIKD